MSLIRILACLIVLCGVDASFCPKPCKCNKDFTEVKCSKKGLLQIPVNIPNTVKRLDLSNNLIQLVQVASFRGLKQLQNLDLTNNILHSIDNGSFADLTSLKHIYLGKNRLTEIPDPTGLVSLEDFILEASLLKNIVFPSGFLKLTKLKRITLTENFQEVKKLDEKSFESLKNAHVSRLYISKCNIVEIANGTFVPLKHVVSLSLSYNPIDGIQLARALSGFNSSKQLMSLKLSGLKFDGKFPVGAFDILKKSPISLIDLSHNIIREIKTGAFNGLYKLTNLNLRSCQINTIENGAFDDLRSLKILTFQNNSLSSVPVQLPPTLQHLDLSWNINIRVLKNMEFVNLKDLRNLILKHNYLVGLEEFTFAGLHQVATLDLSENKLSNLPKNGFSSNRQLKYLFLNKNNLKTIQPAKTSPFGTLRNLVYLDLSDNDCENFPPNLLKELVKLKSLFLKNNRLGINFRLQEYSFFFSDTSSLQELNLDGNGICLLPQNLFHSMKSLVKLSLRNNRISHWSPELFAPLKSIESLDLSNNLITLINKTSVRNISVNGNFAFNLTGNPFVCTCDLLWFRQWVNVTNFSFPGIGEYTCNSPHNLQNTKLLDWHPDPKDCINYLPFYVGGSVCGTVLLMLVIAGASYRRRWFIRLSWYKMTHGRHTTKNGYRSLDDDAGLFSFDAFVSFCEEDRQWVFDTLMKTLDEEYSEGADNFKICHDDRDFPPNLPTAGCILESIVNSRKFILVVSEDYEFCGRLEIELHCALQERMEDGTFEIIVVLKDNPPLSRIPRLVAHLVSDPDQAACVEWPSDNEDGQQLCVQRLHSMLERGLENVRD